jgi:hypothetical protein
MKLILNLLLLFVVFSLVRRAIRRFLAPPPAEPTEPPRTGGRPHEAAGSGKHPAIDESQIEDAEFEELD